MKVLSELNQADFGGVEEVVRCISKFDLENDHTVLIYRDGPMKAKIEEAGAKVIISPPKIEINLKEYDLFHLHCGGMYSNLLSQNGNSKLKFIETIHSPISSPHPDNLIIQRIGNSSLVTKMNRKCRTILNGIDSEIMKVTIPKEKMKEDLGIKTDLPIVGRLGRLATDKWLEEWILICYYAQQEIDFIPLIVGPETQKNFLGKIKLMVESLPLRNVIFTGARQDKANLYNIMDAFLYPSPTEGFGLVFLEALHFGLPVITLKTEVTSEVLGQGAILMQYDIKEMAKKLVDVLRQKSFYTEALKVGAQDFAVDFSAERMVKEYQEVYRGIMN